ncbi:MAG: carboxypeptidase regulatory-like domain-containing protein [Nitrospiria bacterium]
MLDSIKIFKNEKNRNRGFELGYFLTKGFLYRLAVITFLGVIGASNIALAEEYKEIEIKDGGSISGEVFLKGPVPSPRIFHLNLYPFAYFCKKVSDGNDNRLLSEFAVSDAGGLQDVVVVVKGVSRGKAFSTPEGVTHATNCVFLPFVSVVKNPQAIKVINDDSVFHNIQVYQSEKGNIVFNSPLPVQSTEAGVLKFEPSKHVAQWICGMHEFMQRWSYVVENPYFAITKADGSFKIDRIPPGTYTITAWHAHMKISEQKVTIRAGKVSPVNFEFQSSELIYPEYEKQEKGRLQPHEKDYRPERK